MDHKNTTSAEANTPENSRSTPLALVQGKFLNTILPIAQQKLLDWFQRLITSESAEAKSIGGSIDFRASVKLSEFHRDWQNTCHLMLQNWKEWHEKLTESILKELAESRTMSADAHAKWQQIAWGGIRLLAVMTMFWAAVQITQMFHESRCAVLETQLQGKTQELATLQGQLERLTMQLREAEQEKARLNLYYGQDGSIWVSTNQVYLRATDQRPSLYQVAPPTR